MAYKSPRDKWYPTTQEWNRDDLLQQLLEEFLTEAASEAGVPQLDYPSSDVGEEGFIVYDKLKAVPR